MTKLIQFLGGLDRRRTAQGEHLFTGRHGLHIVFRGAAQIADGSTRVTTIQDETDPPMVVSGDDVDQILEWYRRGEEVIDVGIAGSKEETAIFSDFPVS